MKDMIRCHHCDGLGRLKLNGLAAETLKLLRKQPAEIHGAALAEIAGCAATAMNNRLAQLEKFIPSLWSPASVQAMWEGWGFMNPWNWWNYDSWRLHGFDDDPEGDDEEADETGTVDSASDVEADFPVAGVASVSCVHENRAADSDNPCDDDVASV